MEEVRYYRRELLEAILVASMLKDDSRFPTIEEFILSELINGTIDYVGGNAGQVNYRDLRYERSSFERKLWEHFEAEMKSAKGGINPRVKTAIEEMCRPCLVCPDGPGHPYYRTELYTIFKGVFYGMDGICPVIMRSTFSLPHEVVSNAQRNLIPSLPDSERRDVEGIGKSMRKYINGDLEFIRKTYHW